MAATKTVQQRIATFMRATALWPLLALTIVEAMGASVRATVNRNNLPLTESLTLSIIFEGVQGAQPDLPAIPNFEIVERSSSFSADLARGISQQVVSYQLQPKQAGTFVIPAFQFNLGGQVLTTQPITVTVSAPTVIPWFAKIAMPKPHLYVGEVSEAEVRVYYREGGMQHFPVLPADPGFKVGGKWKEPASTRETISNQVYNVYSFKMPITPVKGGMLELGPANATVLVPDRSRPPNIFGQQPSRAVSVTAEKIMVQVLPVPTENAPPTFAGAVGTFNLSVRAAPTNVAAGDPITVRVQINGRGALDSVQLPPQPDWTEFKTYPPTSKLEGADANNTSGSKIFEQAVVPERAGINVLPPFVFSFFDPNQGAFRTLKGPAFALNVAPAGGGAALPSLPGSTNAAPAQPKSDLAHIKPHLGTALPGALLLTRPWFLAVQLAPPLLWLALLWRRKRHERFLNDPRLRRRAEVFHKVRDGLKDLRAQAEANDSEKFFTTGLKLLQEQIGERLDAPSNAITEAVVAERLRPAGAPPELCGAVQELFQMCDLARYAPVKSSAELTALLPKFDVTLRALQQWEPASL